MSNLTYNQNEKQIKKIIGDKGVEFIVDGLKYFSDKEKTEIVDPAIDALTHISSIPDSLNYVEQNKQDSIDVLVDILRQ